MVGLLPGAGADRHCADPGRCRAARADRTSETHRRFGRDPGAHGDLSVVRGARRRSDRRGQGDLRGLRPDPAHGGALSATDADGDWLRRRIAQALGLAEGPAWALVPGRVWRLGDVGRAGRRRRVLFGKRLGEVAVQRALLSLWSTHIGDIPTILVTTTAPERVYLPGVEVQLVPLPAAFRVRGDGLVADDAVWAGLQSAWLSTQVCRGTALSRTISATSCCLANPSRSR